MKIKDLKERDVFEMPLLLAKSTSGTTNAGSPYLSLTLQDASGSIEAKLWDVKPEIAELCATGKILKFKGQVNLYQNALQLKIVEVSPVDEEKLDVSDFLPASPIEIPALKAALNSIIAQIASPLLKKTVVSLYEKYQEKLYEYPAASRNHHDYFGGLAVHIKTMADLALKVCEIYPEINSDLLLSGVLLHDLGKIEELSGPIATEYTLPGKLLGHISITYGELCKYAAQQALEDNEEIILLKHMILSHHGEYEFGSPVLPLTKEAEVLSFVDNLDAKLNMIDKAVELVRPGEFSQRSFSLEGRSFYKAKGKSDE